MPVVGTDAASVGSGASAGSAAPAAPLDGAWLRSVLLAPGCLWTDLRIVPRTGSTNADVSALALDGAPQGLVIAAETQVSGRGRQGRSWQSLPGAALTFSVLLRPLSVPQAARGWVPLLAGLAAATAIRDLTTADARLKWPNDILVGDGKLAGILAEQHGDAIVVGIGLNVLGLARDLPVASATSLELLGLAGTDRTELLAQILRQLEHWYSRWCEAWHGGRGWLRAEA